MPEIASRAKYYVVSGEVSDPVTCAVVPDAEVFQINLQGALREIECDDLGRFSVPMDQEFGWASVIYARHGDLISQWETPRNAASLFREFELRQPAQLSGVVRAEDGSPVAGASIRLKTDRHYASYLWEATTDGDGAYVFEGLPPGDVFIDFVHERYRSESLSVYQEAARVSLVSGDTAVCDLMVEALTRYSGRTLGPDGAPAGHVELTLKPAGHFGTESKTRSDASGNFSFHAWPEQQVVARHSRLGIQSIRVPTTTSSGATNEIEIQLQGSTRVTGQVRGVLGEPIVGAKLGIYGKYEITDAMGRFDFADLPLPPRDQGLDLYVWPRYSGEWRALANDDGLVPEGFFSNLFYASKVQSLAGFHDGDLTLDIELESLPTRVIGGTIRDETGQPVPGASVLVYSGVSLSAQWMKDLLSKLPVNWPPQLESQTRLMVPPSELLARVLSDDQGRWETSIVMGQNHESWGRGERSDSSRLTVVAGTSDGRQRAVVRKVIADETTEVDVDMVLAPSLEDASATTY